MFGNKGSIIGGTTRAVQKITAFQIGNPMGIATVVEVGHLDEFYKELVNCKNNLQ